MPTKSEAQKGIENIKYLFDLYKENPEKVVWFNRDYYQLESFIKAYNEILLRQALGAETESDKLLLTIMAFSIMG